MNIPTPRLEFRWRTFPEDHAERNRVARWSEIYGEDSQTAFCDYGIVLPLKDHDIRREDKDGNKIREEVFYKFGTTATNCGKDYVLSHAPFRDGAHAQWDSAALSGLPIWVKDQNGMMRPVESEEAA